LSSGPYCIQDDQATIAKALDGDYRVEHLFALKQSLELYDSYQQQIEACHRQIAEHLHCLESKADQSELKPTRIQRKKPR
jgi:transposase